MFWNTANLLTVARIAVIPVFIALFYAPQLFGLAQTAQHDINFWATTIFFFASITDWLDGFWARKFNQTSAFGAFLDPVADKLIVTAALIVLIHLDRVHPIIGFIIIGREIAISALREWMAELGARASVAVAMLGKVKTAVQMLAIGFLLYADALFGVSLLRIGQVLIWIAAILTLVSMFNYLQAAMPTIKKTAR